MISVLIAYLNPMLSSFWAGINNHLCVEVMKHINIIYKNWAQYVNSLSDDKQFRTKNFSEQLFERSWAHTNNLLASNYSPNFSNFIFA